MPLSEQEQRLLDEMERHLMRNDADVVSAAGGRGFSYRNIVYGALLVLAGIGILVVGVATQLIVVGVLGFVAMVGGVVVGALPARGARAASTAGSTPPQARSGQSFMDRMNDRWDRRQEGR
ncbi:DUF3040 domain-containing protein [Microbacterium sediminicola]|uniref:DUF3040 domain-containing protein n=1 Tax=Microbacterium sediminicola TaxID=415210 RepID=A0ABP4TXC7_9MICO